MQVAKILQDVEEEPNSLTRRINQLVEFQGNEGQVSQNLIKHQKKMKALFDKKARDRSLLLG